jgi:hypothetical protein
VRSAASRFLVAVGSVAAAGCGRVPLDLPAVAEGAAGSSGAASAAGTGGVSAGGPGGSAGAVARVPQRHRASSICPPLDLSTRAYDCSAATVIPTLPGSCNGDSQCVNGRNGRCASVPPSGVCLCVYDHCVSDAECPAGQACACNPIEFGNSCVTGGCRVDADCGEGGFCGPEVPPCDDQISGYQCYSPKDTCSSDSDCPDDCIPHESLICPDTYSCRASSGEPWSCQAGVICN